MTQCTCRIEKTREFFFFAEHNFSCPSYFRECLACEKAFKPKVSLSTCCSKKCYNRYHNNRRSLDTSK